VVHEGVDRELTSSTAIIANIGSTRTCVSICLIELCFFCYQRSLEPEIQPRISIFEIAE
jgi:hypothetical protein